MAYSLCDRFPSPSKCFTLIDPGAYQYESTNIIKLNTAPFLSKSSRKTQPRVKLWTHALYNAHISENIPNSTAFKSKRQRFPYAAISREDFEEILCKCGIPKTCECVTGEEEADIICQGKEKRRIFKGQPPRAVLSDEGLSAPFKTDRGFDGSKRRMKLKILDESPPFYEARVHESTAFYKGCKWSQWSSKRFLKSLEDKPGPADYSITKQPTQTEICQEKVREYKRKYSKQPRFIEIIQKRNIAEGRPGPAKYSPNLPKGTELQYLGPKSERYLKSKYNIQPGPTDYFLRRDFDLVEIPEKLCHAKLPEKPCFGMKSLRFKPRRDEGPSPASYYAVKNSQYMCFSKAPFGSSSVRFKDYTNEESSKEMLDECEEKAKKSCPAYTWQFTSKTKRMTPLLKKNDEPSPADLSSIQIKVQRQHQLQYLAPFYSSEGRFRSWYNWIPVMGREKTPGPSYYNLETPRCLPAVHFGPLCRTARFPSCSFQTPAPNEYTVGGGIEIVLQTHNQRLIHNIKNQHEFRWKPLPDNKLSCEEKEAILLQKSIALLETDDGANSKKSSSRASSHKTNNIPEIKKPKLLRCFVHR